MVSPASHRPKVYLGVDPGFADAGYGVVAVADGKERCVAYGSIQTASGADPASRLADVSRELSDILRTFTPDAVAVERLYFSKNTRTALAVAEARGVIRLTVAQHGIRCREFNPADVKLAVCGHGSAPKRQVQRMVASLLGLDGTPKPDDAADGLALAIALASADRFERAVRAGDNDNR